MSPRLTVLIAALLALPALLVAVAPTGVAQEGPTVADVDITSFDRTNLVATLFVPEGADEDNRVPFVLMTHGWAGSRTSTLTGRVADLVNAGYGVLTWDSRGFGASGGEVMLNHPDYEGRDVSVLIDWLVGNAPVATLNGDPVIGMSGGSYAGGIQLIAAAFDDRIDVIAPEIAWNDLLQSLAPNGVPKAYWTTLLFGAGLATSCSNGHQVSATPSGCQTSALARYYASVYATNGVTPEVAAALKARSPATYMDQIDVPTLVVQGFPDTLFNADEGIANYEGIKANGAPVKLWLYDGGHAGPGTQSGLISGTVLDWFACHLALTPDCTGVGAEVEYYTGSEWRSASAWPLTQDAGTKTIAGIPPLMTAPVAGGDPAQTTIALETGGENGIVAIGDVRVDMNIETSSIDATIFAAVGVRSASGTITRVADQTQPIRVTRDDGQVRVEIDLVDVAAEVAPDETLVLTIKTLDNNYLNGRGAGFVYMSDVVVTWGSTALPATPPPPPVIACGGDDTGLSPTGLAIGITMGEEAYDVLGAVTGSVTGSVTVVRDGTRLDDTFVTVVLSRGTWAGNAGREMRVSGTTNEHGALCFAAPLEASLPDTYTVRAEVFESGDVASTKTTYTVSA